MNRALLTKFENLETDYEHQQKRLENKIEEAFYEKQTFSRSLENLSENYRYHYEQGGFSEPIDMRKVYHIVDQGREDGNSIVNQTINKLEDERENGRYFIKRRPNDWKMNSPF